MMGLCFAKAFYTSLLPFWFIQFHFVGIRFQMKQQSIRLYFWNDEFVFRQSYLYVIIQFHFVLIHFQMKQVHQTLLLE